MPYTGFMKPPWLKVRCPCCGMVVSRERLNGRHEFELLSQQSVGRRKWVWIRNYDPRGKAARVIKMLLALRLRSIADRLEREARAEEYLSTSVERSAMVTTALRLPLTKSVERYESTSSSLRLVA
jgi:hypothetical protein